MGQTRKPNRESTISETPNKDGYYEAKVWMGTKPDGSPDRRHRQRKSLPSLKKAVRDLERQRDAGMAGKPGKIPTVQEMLTRHLTVVLPQRNRAPRTIAGYKSICRLFIFPRWGGCRIDKLEPEWLEDAYADLLADGHKPSYVRHVHVLLNSAYKIQAQRSRKYALAGGTVIVNPCDFVDPPDVTEAEKKSLTVAEARAVLKEAERRGKWMRWAYGLATGNRQGEALGLRWDYLDIDVPEDEPGEAEIAWQLQRLTWEHGCGDPAEKQMRSAGASAKDAAEAGDRARRACAQPHCKTKPCRDGCKAHKRACPAPCDEDCQGHAMHCPMRKLPLGCVPLPGCGALVLREVKEKRRRKPRIAAVPPELCAPFREYRSAQLEAKMLAGPEWHDLDFVFCRWDGTPVSPREDWQEWKEILAAAGVTHRGVHGGRHTTATIAVDEGVALTVVKEMLGHSDIRVTEGYVQTASPQAQRAAKTIGRALFGKAE